VVTIPLVAACGGNGDPGKQPGAGTGSAGSSGQTASDSAAGTSGGPGSSGGAPEAGPGDAGTAAEASDADATAIDAPMGDGAVDITSDAGDSSSSAPVPSDGCGKPAGQALATYVRQTVTGSTRVYDLYLPAGYDPKRAYRTIFLAHGCDGSIPFPIQDASKGDAILVALRAAASQATGLRYGGGCFDTGAYANSVHLQEVPYFDQVLKDVSSALCVDKARVFMAGHSSGSWLTNLIGCVRAGVVRAQGNGPGGLPPIPMCTGPIAGMLAHDTTDTLNSIDGGMAARDRLVQIDGCSTQTIPYSYDGNPATPSPCVIYQGCKPGYPVVWCQTTGKGHSTQIPITTVGLWRFWSQF
jgi:polyhydroxybutyrate depolymerase